ncbi:MAG: PIN/TRAM domain-containing protein [Clostridia bacterium]
MSDVIGGGKRPRLRITRTIRFILTGVGFIIGIAVGLYYVEPLRAALGLSLPTLERIGLVVLFGLIGGPIFAYLGPILAEVQIGIGYWIEHRLLRIPVGDIVAGSFGLIFGLIIANLIGSALDQLPWLGRFIPAVSAILLGSVGWIVGVNKKSDLSEWIHGLRFPELFPRGSSKEDEGEEEDVDTSAAIKILDSSTIIDGRIADVAKTGFLEGPLVIPSFILDEVQRIADSSDDARRGRGRRGLDILNRMQQELDIPVRVERMDFDDEAPVDSRLLEAARRFEGKVVTNDYNLNKVAALQGVVVLNINDLANAVKPMVIPGEGMEIFLLREGKEEGQGVGYLEDGTMVVVDDGRPFVGRSLEVVVTSVLQTSAGRMIFAKPKDAKVDAQ